MLRDRWDSRTAFVLASIGSAIGLGNVWRFPYVCYANGGGAFLLAYLVALFVAGIPVLILEFGLGHRMNGSAPESFFKIKKGYEWIGWMAILVGFSIVCYYAVIMSYCFNYGVAAVTQAWGNDPQGYFDKLTGITSGPFEMGSIRLPVIIGLLLSWIWIVLCIWKGARTVGKVVYFTVLIPWFLLIVFVVRGATLPGAIQGLNYYLTPDFGKLLEPQVWLAAFTQVFFSLSIGFGVMIAYGSFLPQDSDIVNNAFVIGLCDAATAFLGGLAVFGALGYYSLITGRPVEAVVSAGPGLAFVTYPAIISNLPFWQPLFGVLFFVMLLTLAIDSAFSLVEGAAAGAQDKWKLSHRSVNISVAVLAFALAIPLTFGGGLYWLDIVDRFMTQFGLISITLVECVVIGYLYGSRKIKEYVNSQSDFSVRGWWDIFIKIVTPIVLLFLIVMEAMARVKSSYGGYPRRAEFIGGWLIVILLPVVGFILMKIRRAEA
jgi:NSS family neurotransmitter:Na+ symporter